jgi:hypothetical protein
MSDQSFIMQPRLIWDIDGVIIAENSPFEMAELSLIEKYAPEVVSRLGKLGMDRVVLSIREGQELSEITALLGARVLALDPDQDNDTITRKELAILTDQKRSPCHRRVWVDDKLVELPEKERRAIAEFLGGSTLFVWPAKETGLNEIELSCIEAFARDSTITSLTTTSTSYYHSK